MAAHMTKCNLQQILKSCISHHSQSSPLLVFGNKKMTFALVTCASFHSGRRVASQVPVLAARLFRCHRQTSVGAPVLSARWNSSNSAASSGFISPPSDYIPPAPPIPEPTSATSELVETLNALGEPTLQSVGLGSYWPSGIVQQGLEAAHVSLGLPWWGTIVLATVFLRMCMFPVVIKAQKMSINMMNHMPTIQRLQLKFTQARQRGNMLEAMQYGGELGDYMKRNNVKPFGQMLMPMCQLPVFVSVFVGLRGMANLPVESMKTGGVLWFPDLTVTEVFYGLPLMTAFTFWLTIEAGVDGMNPQAQTHVMKWILRGMPLVMLPLISNFPTAMLVYWFTSNSFSLMQVMFLKIPAVRKFFNLPERVVHPVTPVEKKGFLEGFKESYSNMKASQQVAERQRLDEKNYRKAAQGPIIKTYAYNPKKVQGSTAARKNVVDDKSKKS
ncbi:mitochondrial inner membrane protein OXA1L [Aplysia californica]|uniref:Mitochondrial inner membrane protein OXA1L n=1 Tax=Aplysia californica TaxID=6500 RepID=A0ABM0JWY4_APLCA|nr:mitochondrial inner membrane protein OXA1L [Aplysia californica]